MLRKVAPKTVVEKLVTQDLTLNRAAVSTLARSGVLKKKTFERIALKVINGYKDTYADERKDGASVEEATAEALNGKRLMVQRVQNAVVHQISEEIKDVYHGEFYTWLPSDAETPDPIHALNYGLTFQLGKGEAPGDRYGCQCGMLIQVAATRLSL